MKKLRIAITLFLAMSFAVSLFAVLPNAEGQVTKVPDRDTGAYISTNPDLTGVNQDLTVNLWVYPSPDGPQWEMGPTLTGLDAAGHEVAGIHFSGVTITFTRPDGSKDTFMPLDGSAANLGLIAGMTEEVGTLWFLYKPNQIGTWSVSFSFPGNTFTSLGYSVYYKPSTSQSITFVVQEDPVQITLPVPLPTGYWERPINAQFREWYSISGDWMPRYINPQGVNTFFQPYGKGPTTAHVLWKNPPLVEGGLIGGDWGSESFGLTRTMPAGITPGAAVWIMDGKAYYNTYDGAYACIDLRTGKLIYQKTGVTISDASIEEGNIRAGTNLAPKYGYEQPVHVVWQYSSTAWTAYLAFNGVQLLSVPINSTKNPSVGAPVWAEDQTICYVLRLGSWSPVTRRRPYAYLVKWNFSKWNALGGDWSNGIEWNVQMLNTTTGLGPGQSSRGAAVKILPNGKPIVAESTASWYYGFDPNTGALLWSHDTSPMVPMGNYWTSEGYLIVYDSAKMMLHCYDISGGSTWKELWSVPLGEYPWDSNLSNPTIGQAYGNLYLASFSGHMFCLDRATGEKKWTFYVGNTTETPYGTWAIYGGLVIADGKVYFGTSEHSPIQPLTRGNKLFCVDAYTGEELWHIMGTPLYTQAMPIAEGYLVYSTEYDKEMYCFGKGQTETSVSVSDGVIAQGSSVLVKGSVLDMSPAQPGTPAISDADMTVWMEYMHKINATLMNNPPNAKGVEVSLDTVDPNNNFVHIATVTSDSAGMFKKMWTPEVPGEYTVIATFHGSDSYWASYAETAIGVFEASAVTPPEEQIVPDNMPIYAAIIGVGIAIIIAVAIAAVLILRKKP